MDRKITLEREVKKEVKKLLDKHKWFWWMPPANAYGKAGIADILAIRGGVFLAIETKVGKNQPSAMQAAFLDSVRAEGCFGFVVSENELEYLEAWLSAFDRAIAAEQKGGAPTPEDGSIMLNCIIGMTRTANGSA